MTAVQLFLPITIALIMIALGLGLTIDDFRRVGRQPRAVAVGMAGQLFVLPATGLAVAAAFDLSPAMALGVVLLTACPGGAHSNLFAHLARADTALSITLTAVSGLLSVVTLPLILKLGTLFFSDADTAVTLPLGQTIGQLLAVVLLPLLAGMLLRAGNPAWARRLEPWIQRLAIVMLLVIVAGSVARQGGQVLAYARDVGPAIVVLNLGAMAAGSLLATIARLPATQIVTVALEVGIQNSALAVGIALGMLGDTALAVPAIVYSLLVYVTGALVVTGARRLPAWR